MWLGRLSPILVYVWLGLTALSVALGISWLRRLRSTQRGFAIVALVVPAVAVLTSLWAFGGGGHPVVQLNDSWTAWRVWAQLWPLCLLGSLVNMTAGFVYTISSTISARNQGMWALTMLVNMCLFLVSLENFPSV